MGDPSLAMQLFDEMEEKDPHLYSVANTRRLALTGLEWRVISAAEVHPHLSGEDVTRADRAAAYCREVLSCLDSFDHVLQHLSLAIGRNLSLAELVWDVVDDELVLVDIDPVDHTRIVFDEIGRPRVLTDQEARDGISLDENKFVVHMPNTVGGHPSRGGLLRVTALSFLAKSLAVKDWMIHTEVFGMPVRIARYEPGVSEEEKREMLRMLETLGNHAAGIFSKAIELEIVDTQGGGQSPPYARLAEFLNREMSKAWLGQTLTTDSSGGSGVLSATQVHNEVRLDLRADDIRKEGFTIRRDVLGPLVRFKFGRDVHVPYFRRKLGRMRDLRELSEMVDSAVNRLGLSVPKSWVHEVLEIPMSGDLGDVVPGSDQEKAIPARRDGSSD
jgi:phage gp29-like protein